VLSNWTKRQWGGGGQPPSGRGGGDALPKGGCDLLPRPVERSCIFIVLLVALGSRAAQIITAFRFKCSRSVIQGLYNNIINEV